MEGNDPSNISTLDAPETLTSKFGIIGNNNQSIGRGDFTFPNGDTYSGFFKASRSGKIVRDGWGVYTTVDGQVYDGIWVSGVLVSPDSFIEFADGSTYCGPLKDMKFNGYGQYTFPDGTTLDVKFFNNCIEGGKDYPDHVQFLDGNGREWFGKIDSGNVTMLAVHHFIPSDWKVTVQDFPELSGMGSVVKVPLKIAKPKFTYPIINRESSTI